MNPDESKQMNSNNLIRIFIFQKYNDYIKELAECQEFYIEEAVEKSGYKDALEVLNYIRKKY